MNAQQLYLRARTLLGDTNAVKYSSEQLEAALFSVLALVNARVPRIQTVETMQQVVDQTLTLESEAAIRDVLQVECLDFQPVRRAAFAYQEAGSIKVCLTEPWPAGLEYNWRIKLVTDHQLEGLDGAETSTIPPSCELLLAYGVASRAIQMRNTQLSESANNPENHTQSGERQAGGYEAHFQNLLQTWQASQPAPAALMPLESGWQDG